MDIVTHGLIGTALALPLAHNSSEAAWISVYSIFPDIFQIPLYLSVGRIHKRKYWLPYNIDWRGFRSRHPYWSELWEVPHSLLFLVLVVLPLTVYFRIPLVALFGYAGHVLTDVFTHTGEWTLKPLYPFRWKIAGWTDAWAWPLKYWVLSWVSLVFVIMYSRIFFH